MKTFLTVLTGLALSLCLASGTAIAGSEAIQTMARITMNMNHFPSDADKAVLKQIIDSDDASEDEADIAMVISNIEHTIREKDIERLEDIIADDSAEDDVRELARILLRVNHKANDGDKATLAALAKD